MKIIDVIRTMLQSKLTLVEELSEAISDKINPDDSMDEKKIHYDIETKIRGQLEEIEEILTRLAFKEPAETSAQSTNKTTGLKMPKFDLPKFKGKYKDCVPKSTDLRRLRGRSWAPSPRSEVEDST